MRKTSRDSGSRERRISRPRLNRTRGRSTIQKSRMTSGTVIGLTLFTMVFAGGLLASHMPRTDALDEQMSASAPPLRERPAPTRASTEMSSGQSSASIATRFSICGALRRTCVVDCDTFWLNGDKIRLADIDTPEISKPGCAAEKALGDRAKQRLAVLLNDGPFELSRIGGRDRDQYGRKLRVAVRNGHSIGDQLVAEGLARTWTGRREPWC